MTIPVTTLAIESEYDVVAARQRARDIAAQAGFEPQDQTRIATAVSEIARNAFQYAGSGRAEYALTEEAPQSLVVRISDRGNGIPDLKSVLSGRHVSKTGMGLGITGARRLMDDFHIESSSSGTTVELRKHLPPNAPPVTGPATARLASELAKRQPEDLLGHLRQQNQEVLKALDDRQKTLEELRRRHDEVQRLNAELEETNRGVVALHAELEDRAERLKQADQMKSRFLSHMSHEFRTPLNSILALCRILLSGFDGPLTEEQQKQIGFIRASGQNLYEMVNDLLDLAKIAAGKMEVRASEFTVATLFGTLRGMFKPLVQSDSVALLFEDPSGIPPLCTDENKVSQILRNFISNALKFTERGEVAVSAALDGENVVFAVRDTGIGIPPEYQERIFEEFSQIENRVQTRVKGTGLGLALSRKLSTVLGGNITLTSAPGQGSTFYLTIPVVYGAVTEAAQVPAEPARVVEVPRILIVDDEEISRYVVRRALSAIRCRIEEAPDADTGLSIAGARRPDVILLDLRMPEKSGFDMLRELRAGDATRGIPVIVVTSKSLTPEERAFLDENVSAVVPKDVLSQEQASERLLGALNKAGVLAG